MSFTWQIINVHFVVAFAIGMLQQQELILGTTYYLLHGE